MGTIKILNVGHVSLLANLVCVYRHSYVASYYIAIYTCGNACRCLLFVLLGAISCYSRMAVILSIIVSFLLLYAQGIAIMIKIIDVLLLMTI